MSYAQINEHCSELTWALRQSYLTCNSRLTPATCYVTFEQYEDKDCHVFFNALFTLYNDLLLRLQLSHISRI